MADRWHLYQTICGDSTDGYAGCDGAGPVAAEMVLDEGAFWMSYEWTMKSGKRKGEVETRWTLDPKTESTAWQRLVRLFEKHGLTEEDALVQARVARICRWDDYDHINKEVKLWTPPN